MRRKRVFLCVSAFAVLLACESAPPPPAHVVVTALGLPTALAIDGDRLWWTTSSGDLVSAPTSGGPTSDPIHVSGIAASAIAFDESAIYVAGAEEGLFRVDRATSIVTQLDTGWVSTVATAGLDGDVVWSVFGAWGTTPVLDVGTKRLALGKITPEILATDGSVVIAVDASGTYWIDGLAYDGVCIFCDPCANAQFPLRALRNDGTVDTLASVTPTVGSIAADGAALFVADACAKTITRFDHDGASTVIATSLEGVDAITLDEDFVYAMQSGTDLGEGILGPPASPFGIVRIPKAGGAATSVVELRSAPFAIAVDDKSVYYLAADDTHPNVRPRELAIFAIDKPRP